jgi:glycerophosphoryl diester phosphodiesterase
MHRRLERAFLLSLLLAGAAWVFRGPLKASRWYLQGRMELVLLSPFPAPASVPVPRRIAHAGGAYHGLAYTNAREALEDNYARGARWFEMDFSRDAHGSWWAVHDWEEAHRRLGIPLDRHGLGRPEQQPAGAPFRLVDLEGVLAWLGGHPEARLVTDTKDDNAILLQRLQSAVPGLRSRIHPQIYRIPEYALARSGGFGAPIFTTYRSRYPWSVLGRFARRGPLLALTVTLDEVPDACRALSGRVPLLTHTVNDAAEEARLVRTGIAGIYTDDLLP